MNSVSGLERVFCRYALLGNLVKKIHLNISCRAAALSLCTHRLQLSHAQKVKNLACSSVTARRSGLSGIDASRSAGRTPGEKGVLVDMDAGR